MSADFLADESLDGRIIRNLRSAGLDIFSVREETPGIPDRDVLVLAKSRNNILITEDSDFGEWVFSHGEPSIGIIFLRYRDHEWEKMAGVLLDLIRTDLEGLYGKFITMTSKRTRRRPIT